MVSGVVKIQYKKGLNVRSEYSKAQSLATRPKRRMVTRAGVAEELSKNPKKKDLGDRDVGVEARPELGEKLRGLRSKKYKRF